MKIYVLRKTERVDLTGYYRLRGWCPRVILFKDFGPAHRNSNRGRSGELLSCFIPSQATNGFVRLLLGMALTCWAC